MLGRKESRLDRGRNLLFGIFAVQHKRVTPTQLMDVASGWAVDSSRGLADRLVEAGAITEADRKLIEGLVDYAVSAHEGDATAAMEAFGGEEQVHQTFRGTIGLTESGVEAAALSSFPHCATPNPRHATSAPTLVDKVLHLELENVSRP